MVAPRPWNVECAFTSLIDDAIIARYTGDLERYDERDGGYIYVPLDTDHIRELLTEFWGELLSTSALEDAFGRLTKDGAANWPAAWCEEDDEENFARQQEFD